jgi:hypothetical protein
LLLARDEGSMGIRLSAGWARYLRGWVRGGRAATSTTQPSAAQARIPCLDGLRALAILFVLFDHLHLLRYVPVQRFFDSGSFGVRVFFVISGYLITKLLIVEHQRTKTISLRMFICGAASDSPAFYGFTCVMSAAEPL